MTYDPTTLTTLLFGCGIFVAATGGALFFLTQLVTKRGCS